MGLKDAVLTAETGKLREERDYARSHLADANTRVKMLETDLTRVNKEMALLSKMSTVPSLSPKVGKKVPKSAGGNHSTAVLMLSDLHLDEVVRPQEVEGSNAFNRAIALSRLDKVFTNAVKVTRDYWSGTTYDGMIVLLGGDTFSGGIHDELRESNADTMFGSMLFWAEPLAAGLRLLADTFGSVHVASVVGNHGRNTRKPRMKFRARDNFDWFFSHMVAMLLRNDSRITWCIPETTDAMVDVYQWKLLLTHGDQTSGGGGIGGIWPPIMRMDAKKSKRQAAVNKPYDLMAMGHWHQLTWGPSFIVNGSLKGLDEYAYIGNFGFEEPQQALWLMTPQHIRTAQAPVFCQDRKAEGW